ncbi:MAG: HNH endonuclease [Myxococcales bacterium]
MSESQPCAPDCLDARLAALANAAEILAWPLPRERDESTCCELARVIDALLVRVARGRGALDVALGEALDVLATGSRVVRVGYSGIGDYAREKLGIAASTAQKMVRFARQLRERPLLRAAVRAGEVTLRAAEAVLPKARGDDEAAWVERARNEPVRALKAAVKGTAPRSDEGSPSDDDEKWIRTRAQIGSDERAVVDKALDLARKASCATAPKWELVMGICEEYLGAHAPPAGLDDDPLPAPREELEAMKEWLENESAQWAFLDRPERIEAPLANAESERDLRLLDAELRRLADLRERWDEVFGHLAMLLRAVDGWRRLGFASFEHYTAERLGMGVRAVAERAALERKLYEVPQLRQAMREKRISYEKARLIARHAAEEEVDAWIERAGRIPCISLRRELQANEERQMCARGEFEVWAPRRAAAVIALAFSAARKAAGHWISAGECLVRIAQHFIDNWEAALAVRSTLQKRVLERDGYVCTVPGCSRAADHAHHIRFRSRGGSDDLSNMTSLCAVHHLQGVHMGRIRVWGSAPHGLHWELGVGISLSR